MSGGALRKLYELPVASTAIPHVHLEFPGAHLDLRFEYRIKGEPRRAGIRFERVRAHRHKAELYCTPDQIEAGYDSLVEVGESPWIRELLTAAPADQRHSWEMHHYLIYFDSNGCYEVIAAGWQLVTGTAAER